ncbi:MAG: hypothetical protein SGI90_00095 [Candidatus Eisenbacteria bacterium]|nr:hypothetical protein [Candidatus Eisenbacteria bacterium]
MTTRGRMGGQGILLIVAALSVAGLVGIEFGFYRPQRARLKAAEARLTSVQMQVDATERRRRGDARILEALGVADDPQALRRFMGTESGLIYLNRTIDASRLTRVDFRTEPVSIDGPFTIERFFITVEGSGLRLLDFIRTIESSPRLARFDQIRMDPVDDSGSLAMRARVSIYSLTDGSGGSP